MNEPPTRSQGLELELRGAFRNGISVSDRAIPSANPLVTEVRSGHQQSHDGQRNRDCANGDARDTLP